MSEGASTNVMDGRIDQVAGELELAIQWQRPCIVMIVYHSELVLNFLQVELERVLYKFNQSITQVYVNKESNDIPLILAESPNIDKTIFYVSKLRQGGGRGGKKAYQALNIHREYLIDYQVRVIFWLTPKEAASLPRYAPDFWAFRHRVFEFLGPPSDERAILSLEGDNQPTNPSQ